jgi:hypothetical protein
MSWPMKLSLIITFIAFCFLFFSLLLREGEPVRIQSTTKEALYFWDAEVFEVSDSAEQAVTISILGDGITVQRRERSGRHNPIPPWQTSQ